MKVKVKKTVANLAGFMIPANSEEQDERIRMLYANMASSISAHYMRNMCVGDVDENYLRGDNLPPISMDMYNQLMSEASRNIRRLRRANAFDPITRCRLVAGNKKDSVLMTIGSLDLESNRPMDYFITLVINADGISSSYFLVVKLGSTTAETTMKYTKLSAMFYSTNKRRATQAAAAYKIGEGDVSYYHLTLINQCLKVLIKGDISTIGSISYTKTEMELFRAIVNNQTSDYDGRVVSCHATAKADIKADVFGEWDDDVPMEIFPNTDRSSWPLIDLSAREWRFINNYVEKNNFGEKEFNLNEYIIGSRYGTDIRFPMKIFFPDVKEDVSLAISLRMDVDEDIVRVQVCDVKEGISIVTFVDFVEVSKFNMPNSIRMVTKAFISSESGVMPASQQEYFNMSPLAKLEPDDIVFIAWNAIKLFIVIHDRPQRTRVVRKTERRVVRNSENPSDPPEEKEFIVARILKPAAEAKELIRQMNEENEGTVRRSAEFQFTMENWERRGHWRRTKNGKEVWIEETTCHRRLPLSEKEVHIKL